MNKGLFVTVEGPDGAGKTTQLARLADYLQQQGAQVLVTREPGGTPAGEAIRAILLAPDMVLGEQAELLLYLAARAEHVRTVVRPALAAGQIVLCDRFCDSTLVYQSMVRGLPLATVQAANDFATGGLAPDLTFLVDADPLLLQARLGKRGGADRMEKEGLAFQQAVRQGFLTLAAHCPARIVTLDASRSEEEVFAAMKAVWIAFEAGKRGGSE